MNPVTEGRGHRSPITSGGSRNAHFSYSATAVEIDVVVVKTCRARSYWRWRRSWRSHRKALRKLRRISKPIRRSGGNHLSARQCYGESGRVRTSKVSVTGTVRRDYFGPEKSSSLAEVIGRGTVTEVVNVEVERKRPSWLAVQRTF